MNGKIFISYRRSDSRGYAGRIHDRLANYFPEEHLFMDVDAIAPGDNFIEAIKVAVNNCDVLIAIIGEHWLTATDKSGNRLLHNADDVVRLEIVTALKRNTRLIPVLLDDTVMPAETDLPDDLKPLSRLNAIGVSHTRFAIDIERLIYILTEILKDSEVPGEEKEQTAKRKVKTSNDQGYSKKIPANTNLTNDVANIIKQLKNLEYVRQESMGLKEEERIWKDATAKNTIVAFNNYCKLYPEGRYLEQAKKAIKEFTNLVEIIRRKALFREMVTSLNKIMPGKIIAKENQFIKFPHPAKKINTRWQIIYLLIFIAGLATGIGLIVSIPVGFLLIYKTFLIKNTITLNLSKNQVETHNLVFPIQGIRRIVRQQIDGDTIWKVGFLNRYEKVKKSRDIADGFFKVPNSDNVHVLTFFNLLTDYYNLKKDMIIDC